MIRKLMTALFMAVFLAVLTSAWTPKIVHAACIVGLNGLICPPTPVPSGGSSGGPSGGSSAGPHKRPPKTQLLNPTKTPTPAPTFTPTSIPPVGFQTGPIEGNAGAAQNPSSSGYPWAATAVEIGVVMLALISVLIRWEARDAAGGLPNGKRQYNPLSVVKIWGAKGSTPKIRNTDSTITKPVDGSSSNIMK